MALNLINVHLQDKAPGAKTIHPDAHPWTAYAFVRMRSSIPQAKRLYSTKPADLQG